MMMMVRNQGFQRIHRMSACIKLSVNRNTTQMHHWVDRNSRDAFTDTIRTPTDLPADPQSAQVPLPGFSTSLFTRCRFVIWSELIMMEGSAPILLLRVRNPPPPAHRAEASFEKCSFISELPDNEAWCSPPADQVSLRASASTVTPSLRCRKRAHDATYLLPRVFLHQFPRRPMTL